MGKLRGALAGCRLMRVWQLRAKGNDGAGSGRLGAGSARKLGRRCLKTEEVRRRAFPRLISRGPIEARYP